jgi:acyl dehydratase
MSHYYEDFTAGGVHESRGRTVTEADIVNFAGLSGDFVELHTNEEYARKSPFGRRIAHGALVFSISTGLMTQMNLINDTVLAFYGIDKLRFTGPVFIGDTVIVYTDKLLVKRRK